MCPDLYGELLGLARRHTPPAEAAELTRRRRRGAAAGFDDRARPSALGCVAPFAGARRSSPGARRGGGARQRFDVERTTAENDPGMDGARSFFDTLPASLRSVSVLLAAGMSRDDVCHVLDLTDVAFRQRLSQLRKRWPADGAPAAMPEDPDLAFGPLRRALLHTLRKDTRMALGAHDPDGHLLLFTPPSRKST